MPPSHCVTTAMSVQTDKEQHEAGLLQPTREDLPEKLNLVLVSYGGAYIQTMTHSKLFMIQLFTGSDSYRASTVNTLPFRELARGGMGI